MEAVVVGASSGGLAALQALLAGLRPGLPVPLIVVCHRGADDSELLCELLARGSPLPVCEARERHAPNPGVVYIAPAGYHLYVEQARYFTLSVDPKVCYVRPSVDLLFESAASAYGAQLLAVVLTGANHDGSAGLRAVRQAGGIGIVQDPADALAPQMPASALREAGADYVLPLNRIASQINELCP